MRLWNSYFFLLTTLVGCGIDPLFERNFCSTYQECGPEQLCSAGQCQSIELTTQGTGCEEDDQCPTGTFCHQNHCVPQCRDIFRPSSCPEPLWCKPTFELIADNRPTPSEYKGRCAQSECDPTMTGQCPIDYTCMGITPHIGACVPKCAYGFIEDQYHTNCPQTGSTALMCHPLGVFNTPTCLPSSHKNGLLQTSTGCHPIDQPCSPGLICINVVCRKPCQPGQADPCTTGQRCTGLAQRSDISYCKAY